MTGKKILMVDDDKRFIEGVGAFLKALGHDMVLAQDGKAALDAIENERPALVLLDIQLPKVNGIEILTQLRSKHKDIKVFVITAYSNDVKWRCDEIGYDNFFPKPVELDPLLDSIKEALSEKAVRREEEVPIEGTPKAKILFIEPDIHVYGYTAGLFESKEFNPGEYEVRVAYDLKEATAMFGDNSIYGFHPDIVIMYDIHREFAELDKIIDYLMTISFKPKEIIVHGIFPRNDFEVERLQRKNVTYCSQNIMNDEDLRKMNKILIDFVARECAKLKLLKKK